MSSLIAMLLIAITAKANDSTAKVTLQKAKVNASIGLAATLIGSVVVYDGILKYSPQQTNIGLLFCGAGAIFGTVAMYQYQTAQVEARLGLKSVSIRVKF